MQALILAAGEGQRLRPLTLDRPKCMVEYQGRAILDYQLDLFRRASIRKVVVVAGYCAGTVDRPGITRVLNPDYNSTNMVHTLFCASDYFTDDLLVSYGDILYDRSILDSVVVEKGDIAVAVSMNWKELWQKRMEDPLRDAETMKISGDRLILELGKKPKSYDEIQGQYMGLFKLSAAILPEILRFYSRMDRQKKYDGQPFQKMYMTSFIQELINGGFQVRAVPVTGQWLEIDSLADLNVSVELGVDK